VKDKNGFLVVMVEILSRSPFCPVKMHVNNYQIQMLGFLVITLTSTTIFALPLKLAQQPSEQQSELISESIMDSNDAFNEYDQNRQLQAEGYARFFNPRPENEVSQVVQKRRFAMGMPNLMHVGMLRKREVEQLNVNKRRIGLNMPNILYMRGMEKRPLSD